MTVQSAEGSIGARIRATRRARGIRTTRELAELITGASVTESIIENIESGRKVNLDVSQLLNIAMALEVPPSYLLAPIGDPNSRLDLPGLSDAFRGLTAIQFDAWLAGLNTPTYPRGSAAARATRLELEALRELTELTLEVQRLAVSIKLERDNPSDVPFRSRETFEERLALAETQLGRLHDYLVSAGWDLEESPKTVIGLKDLFSRPSVFDDKAESS